MPDIVTDGKTRVSYVPGVIGINNIASPDISSEMVNEILLSCLITADGLIGFEPDTADIDNSALCSTFDTKLAGRASFSNTALRLKKQAQVGDTAYDTLVYDAYGHIVIRRGVAFDAALAAGQAVEVYPVHIGQVKNLPPESNSVQKYEVPFKIRLTPNLRAALVA